MFLSAIILNHLKSSLNWLHWIIWYITSITAFSGVLRTLVQGYRLHTQGDHVSHCKAIKFFKYFNLWQVHQELVWYIGIEHLTYLTTLLSTSTCPCTKDALHMVPKYQCVINAGWHLTHLQILEWHIHRKHMALLVWQTYMTQDTNACCVDDKRPRLTRL